MKIENLATNLPALESISKAGDKSGRFGELLTEFIAGVNQDLSKAKEAQMSLVDAKPADFVQLMATIEKADISLRFATEIRNKALEAYQEVMRMQV